MMGSVSFRPDNNCCFGVECDPSRLPYKEYFVRSGNTAAVPGINEDMGNFEVALCDLPSTYDVGDAVCDLWVTAEWEFFNRVLPKTYGGFVSYYATKASSSSVFGVGARTTQTFGALAGVIIGLEVDYTNSITSNPNRIYLIGVPVGTVVAITFSYTLTDDAGTIENQYVNPSTAVNGCAPYDMFFNGSVPTPQQHAESLYSSGNTSLFVSTLYVIVTQEVGSGEPLGPYVDYQATTTGTVSSSQVNIQLNIVGQGLGFYPR
jgi:hypothetical protein